MERTDLPAAAVTPDNLRPTRILDHASDRVQAVVRRLPGPSGATRGWLQAAYRLLRDDVRPVYTVDELQPTSVTLAKGRGSCSQRFACLESLARAAGIGTRVRGLWMAGRFWNPRFPLAAPFIPAQILLAWPQFHVDGAWTGVESLFELPARMAERNPLAFANDGETLFDAIDHLAVDFEGTTAACGAGGCDLSGFVVGEAGLFESRDELFAGSRLFQHTLRGRVFELLYGGRKSH
ncbi:MAG: transglutaminase domain-containing protein [Planctomycetaceae bacterium]